jgi:Na+/proline symporter
LYPNDFGPLASNVEVGRIFTTAFGLKAVAFTDVLACIVLIAGAALLCLIDLREVGGVGMPIGRVSAEPWAAEHFELLPAASHSTYPCPALVLGLGLVLGPAYRVGNQVRPRLYFR